MHKNRTRWSPRLNCRHPQPLFTGGLRLFSGLAWLYHKTAKENQGRAGDDVEPG